MERAIAVGRTALGVITLAFGVNVHVNLIPGPKFGPDAQAFLEAVITAGYLLPIVGALMIVVGIFLVGNKHVPLGLIALFPISFNILAFHLFLDIRTIAIPLLIFALNVWLLYAYWGEYEHFVEA